MAAIDLARWQFAITTVYHFLFVPLSIGLAYLVAFMETVYVVKDDERFKQLAKFWGKLFMLNFAVGVVTGIIQEFQFGMNWSDYSRFVGDIFGGPLAVEALVSFFLESTFIGIWIFGWERLPKKIHLLAIWMVAIGTTISAFWILTANAWMQEPVGFIVQNGHAVMNDFGALLMTKQLWTEFPHVIFGALATGAFFVTGVSSYQLLRKYEVQLFKISLTIGLIVAFFSSLLVAIAGHDQAQHLMVNQPMKMAASEALWDTSGKSAPWTVFASIDTEHQKNSFAFEVPGLLSMLAYNKFEGQVKGIHQLQREYVQKYGPGDYVPPVKTTFWSFRIMVVTGSLMILLGLYGIVKILLDQMERLTIFLKILLWSIPLPFIANSSGWIMTEIGRQPWGVFGFLKTADGVSPTVTAGMIWTSMIGFTVIYGLLAAALIKLFVHFIKKGVPAQTTLNGQEERAEQPSKSAFGSTAEVI